MRQHALASHITTNHFTLHHHCLHRDKVVPAHGTGPSQEMQKHRMKTEEMFTLYFRMQQDGVKENRAALAAK